MIYLIDMDGVITNSDKGFEARWKEMFPDRPHIPYEKMSKFRMEELYPEEDKPKVDKVWGSDGLFASLEPMPGSLEALPELSKNGDVFICTRPLGSSKTCVQDKWDWVKKYLGIDWARKLVITKDKTLIHGDILIDDKPEIKGIREPSWEHVLYNHPWNQHVDGKRRLTWKNYREVLGI